MKNRKRRLSLLVLTTLLITSCGSTSGGQSPTSDTTDSTAPADTEYQYDYPELDMDGADFTMLNSTTTWGFYTDIHFDEATGDNLDDAVYKRNTSIEERFNVNFVVEEDDIDTTYKLVNTAVMSGDDQYQVAFLRCDQLSAMITDKYFYDLNRIAELRLDEDWWDQNVLDVVRIGKDDVTYFAATDFTLMGFDGTICTFINENMMNDLNAEMPYELVRQGKWTLDEMQKLMTLGASLNGDESFAWDANGSAVYGLTSWGTCAHALLFGAGARYTERGENGLPMIAFENERFYNACEKIGKLLSVEGEWLLLNTNQDPDHYEMAFKRGRALMTVAELKASSKFRDMEYTFGIVPMPKFDEEQKEYSTYRAPVNPVMCIPVTNGSASEAAIIMDALTYLSYRDVLPVYYDISVSQKGLRNEESIEMLEIIRDTRYFDIAKCYGWTSSLYGSIESLLTAGNGAVASTIASGKSVVLENIDKTLELLGEK